MKILITGGSGYLGSCLLKALMKKNNKIFLLLRPSSKLQLSNKETSKIKIGYFNSDNDVDIFIKEVRPDIVLNTVCVYGKNNDSYLDVIDANVRIGMLVINSLISLNKPVSFINSDTTLSRDLSLYSLSKSHFAEYGSFLADNNNNFQFINLLIHNFYGQGDNVKKFPMDVIYACYNNQSVLNLTYGEQSRDFIYIEDLIDAYLVIISKVNELEQNSIIEIGSEEISTIRRFVEIVHNLTKSKTKLLFGKLPYRRNEVMITNSSNKKIKSLGWEPKFDLYNGIKKTIKIEFGI